MKGWSITFTLKPVCVYLYFETDERYCPDLWPNVTRALIIINVEIIILLIYLDGVGQQGEGGFGRIVSSYKHKMAVNIFTFRVIKCENHQGSIMTDLSARTDGQMDGRTLLRLFCEFLIAHRKTLDGNDERRRLQGMMMRGR